MIGFIRPSQYKENEQIFHLGWFLSFWDGRIYSRSNDSGESFCRQINIGDLVGVQFDAEAKEISYSLNETPLGVAFRDVDQAGEELFPCGTVGEMGLQVAIEDG